MGKKLLGRSSMLLAAVFAGVIAIPQISVGQDTTCCLSVKVNTISGEKEGGFLGIGGHNKVTMNIGWAPCGSLKEMAAKSFLRYDVLFTEDLKGNTGKSETVVGDTSVSLTKEMVPAKQYFVLVSAIARIDNVSKTVCDTFITVSYPAETNAQRSSPNNEGSLGGVMIWGVWNSSILGKSAMGLAAILVIIATIVWIRCQKTMRWKGLFPTRSEIDDNFERAKIIEEVFGKSSILLPPDKQEALIKRTIVTAERFYHDMPLAFKKNKKYDVPNRLVKEKQKSSPKQSEGEETKDASYHSEEPKDSLHMLPTVRILKAAAEARMEYGLTPTISKNQIQDEIRKVVVAQSEAEAETLNKGSNVDWLWYIGFTLPLLGLFGTVTGLAVAFDAYSKAIDAALPHPNIAPGITEAIATTIWGLLFGIPAMLGYYYYSHKLDRIAGEW